MAERFPNSTFVGLDYGEDAIKSAKHLVDSMGVHNVTLQQTNAEAMPETWDGTFDFVYVYDVIHDTSNPIKILSNINKLLKADGIFSMVEINCKSDHFENRNNSALAMCYSSSIYYCLPSSLNSPPFAGQGACWGIQEIRKTLLACGFRVEKQHVMNGERTINFICRKNI